ncbi:P-loop containing nucleoside triphosphate hydrolase protein [Irpex rosettiformis]|uniref:P-loop containing nucleoside triphosphate hydrolase protein n=1 Tax=Irpex rosettiformis TaxID=378272 RepID=A0ACB8U6R9_9APHY|nr:P-loop containing nucleoside triphosphate hydrolase protein [Irpex rosettiformis]
MASEPTLSSLAALAAATSGSSTPSIDMDKPEATRTKEQQRRHYIRALHKVIDESDIIILVLDARDPEGCRSKLVEEEVRRRESEGKRLIFVLNKIDLIPKDNAQAWLKYLRHTTPTLPFRSASNSQRTNLSSTTAPALVRLLKAYRPSAAQSVTVGVVGYPNVGKSSLINSLKRSKVCAVAAQAGHTKELQTIQLERGLKIVDSPGVVFDDAEDVVDSAGRSRAKGSVLLRNVVKVEDVEDPIAVVEEIIKRSDPETLIKIYNLPYMMPTTAEFLTMLALITGRLYKGGAPDVQAAARVVIQDWNNHKIPFFSVPPTIHPSSLPAMTSAGQIAPGAEQVGQSRILTELGKPFELGALFQGADEGAFGNNGDAEMSMSGDAEGQEEVEMDEASNLMEADDSETTVLSHKRARSPSPSPSISLNTVAQRSTTSEPDYAHRAPKRLRRSHDIPDYHAPVDAHRLATKNPMNRRMLKKAAKKARRDGRPQGVQGNTMEVDEVNLGGTFFASPGFNFEVEA